MQASGRILFGIREGKKEFWEGRSLWKICDAQYWTRPGFYYLARIFLRLCVFFQQWKAILDLVR